MSEQTKAVKMEKFILTKALHMGFIKETFAKGTLIEKNSVENKLLIDGKTYDSTKDLEILLRENWAEPFSQERFDTLAAERAVFQKKVPTPKIKPEIKEISNRNMKVIESDQDVNADIDIRHTKKAKVEKIDKKAPLEVIAGDESDEERIARLQTEIPKMTVVESDALGADGDSTPSLNAGSIKILSKEQHEVKRLEAMKKNAERVKVDIQTPLQAAKGESEQLNTEQMFEIVQASVPEATTLVGKDISEATAHTALEALKDSSQATVNATAKKSPGRPKGSCNKVKAEALVQ